MTKAEELIYSFPLGEFAKEMRGKIKDFVPHLGDIVYFRLNSYFVCEATITEVTFILHDGTKEKSSAWFYLFKEIGDADSHYWFPVSTGEKDELGWGKTRDADLTELQRYKDNGYKIVNILVDVDLPVGHSFDTQFSSKYRYEDAYKYLNDALKVLKPFKHAKKRHKSSALHRYVRNNKRFIASTHKKQVEQMDWPTYRMFKERKVFCRKR